MEWDGKCPVCKKKWDPNDEGVVECDSCKLWVHDTCDKGVGPVLDNPEIEFFCRACLGQDEVDLRGHRLDAPLPPDSSRGRAVATTAAAESAREA
ncbi:unnamed protein product, partial [Laminaria digitata]